MRAQPRLTFAEEVHLGLSDPLRKKLPTKYLYDDVGSALFEAITALEEYGLTRAELRLLDAHGAAIAGLSSGVGQIIELGSGSGVKAGLLLSGFSSDVIYRPIDLSRAALDRCCTDVSRFRVQPIQADFISGLDRAAAQREPGRMLVAFLGSNIGNFTRDEIPRLLLSIAQRLMRRDLLLIGADLIKPVDRLLLAYDDVAGVTAAFNRNLLVRVNRELGADFNPRMYRHEVRWDEECRRIEMHLRPIETQTVWVQQSNSPYQIRPHETIWTESSHKFEPGEIASLARQAGFVDVHSWADAEWPFAEALLELA
ncbi:MAG TPA: L-histidine N(alpha)-methyltransferase [Bryobacteraceae bacterium]|nr:L-histidine N(alpha)-methyltransferase [Bryobacteraceae bacterium]